MSREYHTGLSTASSPRRPGNGGISAYGRRRRHPSLGTHDVQNCSYNPGSCPDCSWHRTAGFLHSEKREGLFSSGLGPVVCCLSGQTRRVYENTCLYTRHAICFPDVARSSEKIDDLLVARQPLNQLPMPRIACGQLFPLPHLKVLKIKSRCHRAPHH